MGAGPQAGRPVGGLDTMQSTCRTMAYFPSYFKLGMISWCDVGRRQRSDGGSWEIGSSPSIMPYWALEAVTWRPSLCKFVNNVLKSAGLPSCTWIPTLVPWTTTMVAPLVVGRFAGKLLGFAV